MSPRRRLDHEACYRAVESRDRRFDGVFYTAVRTTGIYCRPSCPARTPAPANVTFHPTAAAAQSAGFRACKRCLPDATPGSPEWDVAADAAGRAMRLIADGVVDREGVPGLAARVGYTPRHLSRLLTTELGAGPLALARARRVQTARTLVEATDLPLTEVAFASGFASLRQFNQTVREVYDATPSQLRGRRAVRRRDTGATDGWATLTLRLAVRTPFAGAALHHFLAVHVVPGLEEVRGPTYSRTLDLPHGPGVLAVDLRDLADERGTAVVSVTFRLADLRDTAAAVERTRRLLDADCDPTAVDRALGADPLLAPLVERLPGLRVPGHVDGPEAALRTVLGQQVSLAAARTLTARLVAVHGAVLPTPVGTLTHVFPSASTVATVDPASLAMPAARARALVGLAAALADGDVPLHGGADRVEARAGLLALPGIGPWTADCIAMRALGDPDAFLPTDIATRRALAHLGVARADATALPERWRPWRSYAQLHLWHDYLRRLHEETP